MGADRIVQETWSYMQAGSPKIFFAGNDQATAADLTAVSINAGGLKKGTYTGGDTVVAPGGTTGSVSVSINGTPVGSATLAADSAGPPGGGGVSYAPTITISVPAGQFNAPPGGGFNVTFSFSGFVGCPRNTFSSTWGGQPPTPPPPPPPPPPGKMHVYGHFPDGVEDKGEHDIGDTVTFNSRTYNYVVNYYGNSGTPTVQTWRYSYTASIPAFTVPYVPDGVVEDKHLYSNSEDVKFYRFPSGIVQPTYAEHLYEGWFTPQNVRANRTQWTDGRSLGTKGGTFNVYAHWVSSPVWIYQDGWHRFTPPGATVATIHNVRNIATGQLTQKIYIHNGSRWVQLHGHSVPPF